MDSLYIDKVLLGDRHAFRYFITTYKDMAFSVALSLVKTEHLAEEVTQEAFLQAYLSLPNFKKQSKFSTWLYRIVVHCAYKTMQKKSIEMVSFEMENHDILFEEDAINNLLQVEQRQIINEALIRIPPNESLALRLFYLEELTIQELCEITGWTTANTKVLLFRARKSMYMTLNNLIKGTYYGT
ncbi:RNA polymerase sigma factor [Sphingobacterium sp. SYP-B4668]|uniref:RNA polymerase sigma factor n=1 Tax=Sphingobacterium sp. SYP-B4668 TaxID=2996035 RepID=UPI0022DDE026|nr:sigma-70 family RNA polymerase sigma factor [Sphingobacterium sp. SYP-B4668]